MDMRADLNESLQRQSLSFFNRTPTGVMVSRVISDVGLVVHEPDQRRVFDFQRRHVADRAARGGVRARLAAGDDRLHRFPDRRSADRRSFQAGAPDDQERAKAALRLAVLLHETFQGNRVVKAFGMEEYERTRFNKELKRLFRINMRVPLIKAFTGPMIEALGAVAVVAVVWWAVGSLAGHAHAWQFAGFFTTMMLVYRPFKALSKTNNTHSAGTRRGGARVRDDGRTDRGSRRSRGIELPAGSHRVAFENVSFRYGEDWVLRDINLEIGAGKVVALVGMSGGGKSTLADPIPRFYDVQQGRVTVDGTEAVVVDKQASRSQVERRDCNLGSRPVLRR